jgi:hypothetical protein
MPDATALFNPAQLAVELRSKFGPDGYRKHETLPNAWAGPILYIGEAIFMVLSADGCEVQSASVYDAGDFLNAYGAPISDARALEIAKRELGDLIGHKDWADAVERYTDRYSEGGRYL